MDPQNHADVEEPSGPSRTTSPAVVALAVALVASLLGNVVLSNRLSAERNEATALSARVDALEQDLETLRGRIRGAGPDDPLGRIAGAVERLRGLDFRRTVRPELLAPSAFSTRVRRLFTRENDRAEVEASAKVLVALGLLDPSVDLWQTLIGLYEEQAAGFYDDESKGLVVSATDARSPSPLVRTFLAHEYTHALTDQRLGTQRLRRLQDQRRDDEAAAYIALLEGDATLVQDLYVDQVLTDDERAQLIAESARVPRERFDALPTFLQEVFLFPYQQGLDFVSALHSRGGFDLVDQAYRDPPTSTEQIIHPTRYADDRDDPVTVLMPSVGAALGSAWDRLDAGGVGELDTRLILDQFLSTSESARGAEGWDGGRYLALEAGERVIVAALTAWDSTAEAREASRAFERWLPLRYGSVGSDTDVGGEGRGWSSPRGAGMVLRNEDRLLVLLGPDDGAVRRAREAFSGF